VAAALTVCAAGVRLTRSAEALARITGLGDLLTGAILIGFVTSLSGLVTSVTSAYEGNASLAVSNALGGIAAQTVFIVVADLVYPHANLEHAAASESNLVQSTLLLVLLALPVLALALPGLTLLGIHPVSVLLVLMYLFGLRLIASANRRPMWQPTETEETRAEASASTLDAPRGNTALWAGFSALALIVGISGWVLAKSGAQLTTSFGIDASIVGGVFTAITTSLPELVVAVTAVRRGLLALALGDILGGNSFDVLFLAAADIAYPHGSIYGFLGSGDLFWVGLSIVMVGFLLLGLLRRERHGVGNIGFEGTAVLLLYGAGLLALIATGGA
jgi:cation:H+ antiporter